MKFLHYILPAFALVLFSCKKEPLPDLPEENTPFYSIRGIVDADSINWIVGLDEATISYGTAEMNGIKTYYGQINSGTNDMAIRVEILQPELIYDGSTISAIQSGETNYLVHQPGAIKFNFGMNYSQFNYVLVKDANNDFSFSSEIAFEEYGVHNLVLKFTDYSSSESFNLPVRYGFEYSTLKPTFHSTSMGDTLVVTPETTNGIHSWYVNGQYVSSDAIFQKELPDGIYEIRHRLNDLTGNESEHTTLVRMKDGKHYWQMKYFYLTQSEPSSHYGNVIVSMHKNGAWYTSEKTNTNLADVFSISNIKTVIDGQFSASSALFDFEFGSVLLNESGTDSLSLPDMTGTLSVGLK